MQQVLNLTLRNAKNGYWCWQQHQLYDVFQALIGPLGVAVYTNLSRMSQGAPVEASSRKLARSIRVSKDTVLRSLEIMAHLGMIQAATAGSRGVMLYQLVDLKQASENLGLAWDAQSGTKRLPPEVTNRLQSEIAEIKARARRTTVAPGKVPEQPGTVRAVAWCDISGAPSGDASVAPGCGSAAALVLEERNKKENKYNPLPPRRKYLSIQTSRSMPATHAEKGSSRP